MNDMGRGAGGGGETRKRRPRRRLIWPQPGCAGITRGCAWSVTAGLIFGGLPMKFG
jgi:hypothetical protein